jgi:putative ABC transport system substrate-binding protein
MVVPDDRTALSLSCFSAMPRVPEFCLKVCYLADARPNASASEASVRRRDFMVLGVGAMTVWPLRIHAQQPPKVPRIGLLLPGTPASFSLRTKALLDGLRELGHVEGKTIAIEWKWGQDRVETLSELAAELVRSNVDVVITGGTSAARALAAATAIIPIVVAIVGDPVAAGLVNNLARPGGNLTGFSIFAPELGGKRLELLKEIVPNVSSVAVLLNSLNPQSKIELRRCRRRPRQ